MKTVKFLSALFALAALTASADVEALYWQVTAAQNPNNVEFDYAALVATKDGDSGSPHYFTDLEGSTLQASNSDKKSTEVVASIIGSDYSEGWSFFIELWNNDNGNWSTVGSSSQTYTYAQLQPYMHSTMSMGTLATISPTVVVPEPTSGLLMLVGGALLALRRRRV